MNVLITCAGRRSQTVTAFREAVRGRGKVLACDANAHAPALQEADQAFVVPQVLEENYIDALLKICAEHRVRLLIPALEPELPLLARHQARFAAIETLPLVSSPEVIATCYDKLKTDSFLSACGLPVAKSFFSLESAREALARGELAFPLVVKPRWGVGSIALAFPEDDEEMEFSYRLARKHIARSFLQEVSATDFDRCVMIQERLTGTEYGLDIINDLKGSYVCTFIKRKDRMHSGQTDRAETVRDATLEQMGQTIGTRLGHVAILDCDVFVTREGCYAIDLNPRIGGGYPFSHLAGANLPAALCAWLAGEKPEPGWLRIEPEVVASRCDAFVVTQRPANFPEVNGREPIKTH